VALGEWQIMSAFIPVFPLELVVYPGEELHLHIFEPRYKQLIKDCKNSGEPFGIPTVLDKQIAEMGTLVRLREIAEVHDNGELDIIVDGLQVIRLVEPVYRVPGKLYSGALVDFLEDDPAGDRKLMREILLAIKQLHVTLQIKKTFAKKEAALGSHDVAHHAGLSLREEYHLLTLGTERERQAFLREHLLKILPVALAMEALKERAKRNGHFIRGEAGI
jgi:Lon protease-like protein